MTHHPESAHDDFVLRMRQNSAVLKGVSGAALLATSIAYGFDFIEDKHESWVLDAACAFGMLSGALAVISSLTNYFKIQSTRNSLKQ